MSRDRHIGDNIGRPPQSWFVGWVIVGAAVVLLCVLTWLVMPGCVQVSAMPRPPRLTPLPDGSTTQPAEGPYITIVNQMPDVLIPKGAVLVSGSAGFTDTQVYVGAAIGMAVLVIVATVCIHLPKPGEMFRRLFRGKQTVQQIVIEQPIPPAPKV